MNVEELQDALDRLAEAITWKTETDVLTADLDLAVEAARLVANPNLRAAAIEIIGEEPPDGYPAEFDWEDSIQAVIEQTVKPVVAAALTPQGDPGVGLGGERMDYGPQETPDEYPCGGSCG